MKLKYTFIITILLVTICMGIGIYHKSSYKDFNKLDNALECFAVATIDDDFLANQVKRLEGGINSSNIILAVECKDTFNYRYSCVTQKIEVKKVFKGENIKEGEKFDIARGSSLISLDENALFNGLPIINMGYVNQMIPGKVYLIFLDREIDTYSDDRIFIQSDEFIVAPIFCYDDIENKPVKPQDEIYTYVSYNDIKNNEFFISSEKSKQRILDLKEHLFSIYKYS